MFEEQKRRLAEASRLHEAAIQRKEVARQRAAQRRQQFLSKPLNLLYPYCVGILICASQLQNDATGLKRIPFMNIAKAGIGLWTLRRRIRRVSDTATNTNDEEPLTSHLPSHLQ